MAGGRPAGVPTGCRAYGPSGEEMSVDEVEPLIAGEVHRVGGEASVGDEDDDVAVVDGAAGAVQDVEVGCADRGSGESRLTVLALDDPTAAEGISGLHIGAVVTRSPTWTASGQPSRRIRSRTACSNCR